MLKLKRIIARYLDYFSVIIIGLLVGYYIKIIFNIDVNIIIVVILLAVKDLLFNNKSFFKKIFKLEILTLNYEKPSPLKLILRNIFSIGVISDVLILLKNRTIGDYIFETRVVSSISEIQKENKKHNIYALIIVVISIIPRNMINNYLYPEYYDSITPFIPNNCNSRYVYFQKNDLIKRMNYYTVFECDGVVDLKFIDDLNFKKINTEEELKKYYETLSYFKEKIQNDDLFNPDFEFDIYNMSNLSNNYIIYSVNGNKIYVLSSTNKN